MSSWYGWPRDPLPLVVAVMVLVIIIVFFQLLTR